MIPTLFEFVARNRSKRLRLATRGTFETCAPRGPLPLVEVEVGCKREQREGEDKDIDDPLAIYRQRNGRDVAGCVGEHQEGRGRGRCGNRQREVEPGDPQPGQDEDPIPRSGTLTQNTTVAVLTMRLRTSENHVTRAGTDSAPATSYVHS
jgi:hypothetical protein